ncbi:hypothetical protein RRG08_049158 [Elysia crispata]|uniref:Uncharacterized protein n=1 Tax=Elysia crispata TaxID=231223 RepID=A0AAE1AR58_9GAST|nr:hypothetical protein RRG08_049158 [Elysia crispata]
MSSTSRSIQRPPLAASSRYEPPTTDTQLNTLKKIEAPLAREADNGADGCDSVQLALQDASHLPRKSRANAEVRGGESFNLRWALQSLASQLGRADHSHTYTVKNRRRTKRSPRTIDRYKEGVLSIRRMVEFMMMSH